MEEFMVVQRGGEDCTVERSRERVSTVRRAEWTVIAERLDRP